MSKTMSTATKMTTTSNGKKMYNREYKLEVLQLLRQSSKSRSDLERELGLYSGQISAWEKSLNRDKEQAFPGIGHQTEQEAELRRLRRENEILRQERDILKKAVGVTQ
jgi:transposase